MFIVGKKYKGKNSGRIYDCVWINDRYAVLNSGTSIPTAYYHRDETDFEEYVEPKVVLQTVKVCQSEDGYIYTHTGYTNVGFVGKISIKIENGKLAAVSII